MRKEWEYERQASNLAKLLQQGMQLTCVEHDGFEDLVLGPSPIRHVKKLSVRSCKGFYFDFPKMKEIVALDCTETGIRNRKNEPSSLERARVINCVSCSMIGPWGNYPPYLFDFPVTLHLCS